MSSDQKPAMTSDFDWKAVPQVRCGVLVSKVTEYLAAHPREVVDMELGDWTIEQNSGRFAVMHRTGLANGVRPDNLPETLEGTMPVLVGTGNARVFLIDGAHRVAKALIEKSKTIRAVILTEEETRACVLNGQMARFDRETR
ncbi:MAG: hypothetical protein ACE37I_20080 [Rubinisphaera brasiliensis]|uniref:hypothetical protein n=1 Tax=Rubinisphaera brasiliensis TaxID=119 RepID=UPI003919390C